MKKTITRIFAILFASLLFAAAFTGCANKDADEPIVAKLGKYQITKSEYDDFYNAYMQYAPSFGFDLSTDEGVKAYKEWSITQLSADMILQYYADENGMSLTDDEIKTAEETAESTYNGMLERFASQIDQSLTDEAEKLAAKEKLLSEGLAKDLGITISEYKEKLRMNAKKEAVISKVIQHFHSMVSVTENEVREYFDEIAAQQKADFDANPGNFYTTHSYYMNYGEENGYLRPLYTPEGYISVKHIYIAFKEDGETLAEGERSRTDAEALVNEIQRELDAGADFNALIEKYGEDPGMQAEPYKTIGYYVHEAIIDNFYEGWAEQALSLQNIGDVTEPFYTEYNGSKAIHIIQLTGRLESGTIEYTDELSTILSSGLLGQKQRDNLEARVNELRDIYPLEIYEDVYMSVGSEK